MLFLLWIVERKLKLLSQILVIEIDFVVNLVKQWIEVILFWI